MLRPYFIFTLILCAAIAHAVPWPKNNDHQSKDNNHEALRSLNTTRNEQNLRITVSDNEVNDDNGNFLSEENCTGDGCETLYKLFGHVTNATVNHCENIRSGACNVESPPMNPEEARAILKAQLFNRLMEILKMPPSENDIKSLSLEKQLFNDCMNYKTNYTDFETFVREHKWPDILPDIPGEYAFFDISVMRDPFDSTTNIIVLEPPSRDSIFIRDVEKTFELLNKTYPGQIYGKAIPALKAYLDIVRTSTKDRHAVLTIEQWIENWKERKSTNDIKFDWLRVFKKTFNHVGYNVDKSEFLYISNLDYFDELFKLHEKYDRESLDFIIFSKHLAEELKYWNLSFTDKNEPTYRSKFCFNEINHYGASYALLKELNFEIRPIVEDVLKDIVNVFFSKILRSKEFLIETRRYLLIRLRIATDDFISDVWNENEVSNYYEEFQLTDDYVENIANYRKMLKRMKLKILRDDFKFSLSPASFTSNDIRSKLLFDCVAAANMQTIPVNLRVQNFATYGINMAYNLYSMLIDHINETKLEEFTHKRIDCVNPKNIQDIVRSKDDKRLEIIKQFYSLQIASEALHKSDSYHDVIRFPNGKSLTTDRLFFLVYITNHCANDYEAMLSQFTSTSKELSSAFKCNDSSKQHKCEWPAL